MPRPPPLRTNGSNAFARYSMAERVPRIARDVLAHNTGYPAPIAAAVERLAEAVESDAPLPPPAAPMPDFAAWTAAHREHARETWLGTEWFFAELAFYREMAHACRFWETGRDPYGPIKEEELAGDRPWSRLEAALTGGERPREERVASLLEAALWGNRVDLSYTVAAGRTHTVTEDLVVDERAAALPRLLRPGADVHVVADNAGTELALDLALAGALLEDPGARVTVHLKMQPMFVSDALPGDVWQVLERMRARAGDARMLAHALQGHWTAGRLVLAPDPFWSSPRFAWDAPAHLLDALASATAVVLKGDANYRRFVGDALWPPQTPLGEACAPVRGALVALRTMKSDPVVGLPPGLAERLDATAARWRIDGQRGVIQVSGA